MIRVYYKTFCYGQEAIAWKTFKNLKKAFIFCNQVNGTIEVIA